MQTNQPPARTTPSPKYIVSDEHHFVYFVLQKVACSSVKTALLSLFDLETAPYEEALEDGGKILRVHKLFDKSRHQVDKKRFVNGLKNGRYRDHFKFAFVRNPWDRLVSCYSEKLVGEGRRPDTAPDLNPPGVERRFYLHMPFAEFVEAVHRTPDEEANPHFRSQHLVVCRQGPKKRIMADFVGRFERLNEDFAVVVERIGAPQLQLPHRLRSPNRESRAYADFYDDRLRRLVHERFRDDIEIFGYSF